MIKIAIVGGGVEGASNYRYFSALPNTELFIHDQNPLSQADFAKATLVTGPNYLDNLDQYDLVVHSPAIFPDRLGVDAAKITSSTKEFFAKCPAPIIGITGTKGKGTASSLIAEFLGADGKTVHLVGNIGRPPLDELVNIKATDWVVYELSSFQLMDITTSPHIAVHLMFEPDHLDVHTNMDEYANAKANIFRFQHSDDIAVYYAGSTTAKTAVATSHAHTKIPYDRAAELPDGVYVKENAVYFGKDAIVQTKHMVLLGQHMLDNVCAAVAATHGLIQNTQVYSQVLQSFTGLPHRLQLVAEKRGVKYIDDSISTIPSTAIAAIKAFREPKIIILGGSDKGSEFTELAKTIASSNVEQVFLLGQMADRIEQSLKQTQYKNYRKVASLTEAVAESAKLATKGSVVLLSPACASFDMFSSYAQRGDMFAEAVKDLI